MLVSAIITTHNRLELLQRAVESVLNQTYRNLELIIVDDGSTDGTKEWCRSLTNKAQPEINISFISIPPGRSRGGNYARNLGIDAAKGEAVAFLDDDDVWLADKIALQVEIMKRHQCGVVYGARIVEMVQADDSVKFVESRLNPLYQGDVSHKILTAIFTTTSLILVNKELLESVGRFDENLRYWQEYELMIRLAQYTDVHYVNAPIIWYRVNYRDPARLTNNYSGWREAVEYVHTKHKKLYKGLSFNDSLKSKALVWEDAANRCRISGMNRKAKYYSGLYKMWKLYAAFADGTIIEKIKNRIK